MPNSDRPIPILKLNVHSVNVLMLLSKSYVIFAKKKIEIDLTKTERK